MKRTLILSAGGLVAIAWQTGVVAGLADAGIDVRNADLLIGTGAGACVAAQISSGLSMEMLFQRQVQPSLQGREPVPGAVLERFADGIAQARANGDTVEEIVRRIRSYDPAGATVSEADWRKVIAARLPIDEWPERRLLVVAQENETGERRVFDRNSGVPLVDAIAASCATKGEAPSVTIGQRRYVDPGFSSAENADLALGSRRVLILSHAPEESPVAFASLRSALIALRGDGAMVEVLSPESSRGAGLIREAGERNDPTLRTRSAHDGRAQGRSLAAGAFARLWG